MSNAKLMAIIPAALLPQVFARGVYAVSELELREVRTAMGPAGLVYGETWQLHDRTDDPNGFVRVEMVEVRFAGVPHYFPQYSPEGAMLADLGAHIACVCGDPQGRHPYREDEGDEAGQGHCGCSLCDCGDFVPRPFPGLEPGEAALAVSLSAKGLAARLVVRVA